MKLDALKAVDTYWGLIPRDDHQTPGEDAKADAQVRRVAAGQLGLGPAQDHPQGEARDAGRGRLSRGTVKAFLDAYRELEQAEVAAPGHMAERPPPRSSTAARSLGEAVRQQLSVGRGDRAGDLVQRDQPVLEGAVRLRRGAGVPGPEPGIRVHPVRRIAGSGRSAAGVYWLGMAGPGRRDRPSRSAASTCGSGSRAGRR